MVLVLAHNTWQHLAEYTGKRGGEAPLGCATPHSKTRRMPTFFLSFLRRVHIWGYNGQTSTVSVPETWHLLPPEESAATTRSEARPGNYPEVKAGISDLRFHDLIHEAVSQFFEMGMSVPEVALISGHKDVRQLLRYTHLNPTNVFKKYEAF